MKTIQSIIAVGVLSITFTSCAQDVPKEVSESFANKYQKAKAIKWENEDNNLWEVEFKIANIEYDASFSINGEWLETETEIKVKELPENIKQKIASDFSDFEIEEAEKIETPKYKGFEVEIEKEETKIILVFDENGTILKNTTETQD